MAITQLSMIVYDKIAKTGADLVPCLREMGSNGVVHRLNVLVLVRESILRSDLHP